MILKNQPTEFPEILGYAFPDCIVANNRTRMRTIQEMEEIADEFCRVNGLPLTARVEPSKPVSAELMAKRKAGRRCYEAFGRRLAYGNN